MKLGRRRLTPAEMYPAGETGVRGRMVALASGLRVRVVEAGQEELPAIVLIPGWGCSVWIFHDNIAAIAAAGFHVIAVDLKGHGLSDKPPEASQYTTSAMRDHLVEILDALGLKRAGLVGHSVGAAVVAGVAESFPERVMAIVVVAPVGFAGVRGMMLFRAITPSFAVPMLRLVAGRAFFRVILAFVYGSLRGASNKDLEEFFAPTQFAGFTRALRHLLHEFTWDAAFPDLSVPSMTIVGSKDLLSRPGDAKRYAGPESEIAPLIVEGAGHVMFDEAPTIVNAALIDFFKAQASP